MASIAPAAARAVRRRGRRRGRGRADHLGHEVCSIERASRCRPTFPQPARSVPPTKLSPCHSPSPGPKISTSKIVQKCTISRPESRVRLSAGARRGAGDRRRDGAGVPRRVRLDVGRLRRRLGVLHAVGLPDHVSWRSPSTIAPDASTSGRSTPGACAGCCRPAWCASLGVIVAASAAPVRRRHRTCAGTCGPRSPRSTTGCRSPAATATPPQMAKAAGQRAPLDHYWSLAIEEQFYWVWPLALLACCVAGRRDRRLVASRRAGAAVRRRRRHDRRSAGAPAGVLATPARLPEILARRRARRRRPRQWPVACRGAAGVAGRRPGWWRSSAVAVSWPADRRPGRRRLAAAVRRGVGRR